MDTSKLSLGAICLKWGSRCQAPGQMGHSGRSFNANARLRHSAGHPASTPRSPGHSLNTDLTLSPSTSLKPFTGSPK